MQKELKLKRTILLLLMIVLSVQIKSQVISTNVNLQSGVYEFGLDAPAVDYTQKILTLDEKMKIGMTQVATGGYSFFAIRKNTGAINYVNLPIQYKVTDFTLLGDSIYFCGYEERENYTNAFVGYGGITDLFLSSTGSPTIKVSPINTYEQGDTMFTIRKIRAYYNNNGERIIAGIGSMYYGDATRDIYEFDGLGSFAMVRHYYSKYYYDYVMMYKVNEMSIVINNEDVVLHGASPVYATANQVTLYHNPMAPDSAAHSERFEDLTLTDNSICVISSSSTSDILEIDHQYANHNDRMYVRSIDKNNYNNQHSFMYYTPILYHPDYGIRIETLDNKKLAIVYVMCDPSNAYVTNTVVDKLVFDGEALNFLGSYILDSVHHRDYVLRNIEYLSDVNSLLIQKSVVGHSSIIGARNNVFLLDLDETLTSPYLVFERDLSSIVYEDRYPIWNDINTYNNKDYFSIGNYRGRLQIFDVRNLRQNSDCSRIMSRWINSKEFPRIISAANLELCNFEFVVYNVDNMMLQTVYSPLSSYRAVINTEHLRRVNRPIMKKCAN